MGLEDVLQFNEELLAERGGKEEVVDGLLDLLVAALHEEDEELDEREEVVEFGLVLVPDEYEDDPGGVELVEENLTSVELFLLSGDILEDVGEDIKQENDAEVGGAVGDPGVKVVEDLDNKVLVDEDEVLLVGFE